MQIEVQPKEMGQERDVWLINAGEHNVFFPREHVFHSPGDVKVKTRWVYQNMIKDLSI